MAVTEPPSPARPSSWGGLDWTAPDPSDIRYWWAIEDALRERASVVGAVRTYNRLMTAVERGAFFPVDLMRGMATGLALLARRFVDAYESRMALERAYATRGRRGSGDNLRMHTASSLARATGLSTMAIPAEGAWQRDDDDAHMAVGEWLMAMKRSIDMMRYTNASPRNLAGSTGYNATYDYTRRTNWGMTPYGTASSILAARLACVSDFAGGTHERDEETVGALDPTMGFTVYGRSVAYLNWQSGKWVRTYQCAASAPEIVFRRARGTIVRGLSATLHVSAGAWQEYDLTGDPEADKGKTETKQFYGRLKGVTLTEGANWDIARIEGVEFSTETDLSALTGLGGFASPDEALPYVEDPDPPADGSHSQVSNSMTAGCSVRLYTYLDWGVDGGFRFFDEQDDLRDK